MFTLQEYKRRLQFLVFGSLSLLIASIAILMVDASRLAAAAVQTTVTDQRTPGGALLIAGGGRVTQEIRQRFVELAGGPHAQIVVIPASEPVPGEEEKWLTPWRNVGCSNVTMLNAHDRAAANSAEFCGVLSQATGVWFSGGYQDFLADRYVDTAVQTCLHDVLHRNGVIGGCSAGAAILSRVMIKEGEINPVEARGLDLISNAIVDQHFLKRNRLWRLQQILESHPDFFGLGVDESTAGVVDVNSWRLTVVGDSYAMVCLPAVSPNSGRIEVLKSGDSAFLSDLRKDHLSYHPPVDATKVITQAHKSHSA